MRDVIVVGRQNITICFALKIELLWRRSLGNLDGGLFCLVNVDLLDYSVSQKAADTLSFLLQEPWYNRNEGDVSSHFVSKITPLYEFDEKKSENSPTGYSYFK